MYDALARIALSTSTAWQQVLNELCRVLKERHGSAIHLYCATPEEARHYAAINTDGRFASISHGGTVLEQAAAAGAVDMNAALAWEKKLGTTIAALSMTSRHLGRGFALGGFHHPRSRYSEQSDHGQVLATYTRLLDFWRREIETKRITLFINGSVELIRLASAYGIPVRTLIHARHGNYHYWSDDAYFGHSALESEYVRTPPVADAAIQSPYKSHLDLRVVYLKNMGLWPTARVMAWQAARQAYYRLRGYRKGRAYLLRDTLRMHLRQWRADKFLTGPRMARLADMEGRKFVFFPLHTEPETALQRSSPEYFFQLGAIASLARDLPADHVLVVKETYENRGRRPDNFYAQILSFKNVVLMEMLELGLEVVKRARAVATISGTAGMEAAVLGVPVISFGRHNLYNFLPHVRVIGREEDLKPALDAALSDSFDRDSAARDGARFLAALKTSSFDLRSLDLLKQNAPEPEAVEDAYRALVASVAGAPQAARAASTVSA